MEARSEPQSARTPAAGGETITRRNILLRSRQRYIGGARSYLLLDTRQNVTVASGSDSLLPDLRYNLFLNGAEAENGEVPQRSRAAGLTTAPTRSEVGGRAVARAAAS